jgi:hypothetical protein
MDEIKPIGTFELTTERGKFLVCIHQRGWVERPIHRPRVFVEVMLMHCAKIMRAEVILNSAGYCYLCPELCTFSEDLTKAHSDAMDDIASLAIAIAVEQLEKVRSKKKTS